jgi:hypothetical protein
VLIHGGFWRPRGGKLAEIPGAGHFDLIDPQSEAWPMVLAALAGTFP